MSLQVQVQRRQVWSAPVGYRGPREDDCDARERNCQVAINYEKLEEFCSKFASGSGSHEFAMSEYPSLFIKTDRKREQPTHHPRPHTCLGIQSTADSSPSHDVKVHMAAIRRPKKVEDVILIAARVKAILSIVQKPPVMRSDRETKKLAHQLEFFSNLFPAPDEEVSLSEFYFGLAQRAALERIPAAGYAIPGRNGVHLVLQGKVEKRSKADDTKFIIKSTVLRPGRSFGVINKSSADSSQIAWPVYPYYCTLSPCCLLNVTSTDYHRVVQICRKQFLEERQSLVKQCPLFHGASLLVTSHLTKTIELATIPANTIVAREGDIIDKVMFIKEGTCTAMAKVPTKSGALRLTVGTLGPNDCIGEVLIWDGTERHPYTIVSCTDLLVGQINCSSFESIEVQKHISIHGKLSLPILSQKQLRSRHARYMMKSQWKKVKDHVVKEVVTERGIEFDTKKWRHILSK